MRLNQKQGEAELIGKDFIYFRVLLHCVLVGSLCTSNVLELEAERGRTHGDAFQTPRANVRCEHDRMCKLYCSNLTIGWLNWVGVAELIKKPQANAHYKTMVKILNCCFECCSNESSQAITPFWPWLALVGSSWLKRIVRTQ